MSETEVVSLVLKDLITGILTRIATSDRRHNIDKDTSCERKTKKSRVDLLGHMKLTRPMINFTIIPKSYIFAVGTKNSVKITNIIGETKGKDIYMGYDMEHKDINYCIKPCDHSIESPEYLIHGYVSNAISSTIEDSKNNDSKKIEDAMNHYYVTKLYGYSTFYRYNYMITEYGGRDMFDYVVKNTIPIEYVLRYFRMMCISIKMCHDNGIIYRDVKLENYVINLKTHVVKLIDFGESTTMSRDYPFFNRGRTGTSIYIGPDVLANPTTIEKDSHKQNEKGDIWALGICLYVLMYKHHPFNAETQAGIVKNIIKMKFWSSILMEKSLCEKTDKINALILSILKRNPDMRPSIDDIISRVEAI